MQITLKKFIEKYIGKEVDFDGMYQGQCFDLYRQYVKEVLGFPQSAPTGQKGAKYLWEGFNNDPVLVENYTKVPNTADFTPLAGDIMIWNANAGQGYGHVAICTGENTGLQYFKSFDQNWSKISYCEIVNHSYKNVYGVLRPKKTVEEDVDNSALEACLKQHGELVNKCNEKDKEIEGLIKERNNIGEAYKQSQNSLKAEQEAHKSTKKNHQGFIDTLADIFGSVHSEESVIKFASKNSNAFDDYLKFKDLYEREQQARKSDYLKHQEEVKGLQEQLDDLKAQNDRLASKLANLGLQISNKLNEVDEAKDKIIKDDVKPSKSLWDYIFGLLSILKRK